MNIPSEYPQPKLCQLRKKSDFKGYGFNMHSEKAKPWQFVGKVEPNSPAEESGLEVRDTIIEVNGMNIDDMPHHEVVELVKVHPDRVDLFVCALETREYCKQNAIVLTSSPQPEPSFTVDDDEEETKEEENEEERDAEEKEEEVKKEESPAVATSAATPAAASAATSAAASSQPRRRKEAPATQSEERNADDPVGGVSLGDMMARVGKNKRTQVKHDTSSFSEKYNAFQSM